MKICDIIETASGDEKSKQNWRKFSHIMMGNNLVSGRDWVINKDDSVDLNIDISFRGDIVDDNGELIVNFNKVCGFRLSCSTKALSSGKGLPKHVGKGTNGSFKHWPFRLSLEHRATNFRDTTDYPRRCDGNYDLSNCMILNDLRGIHKNINEINGDLALPDEIETGGLGILLIKGLQTVKIQSFNAAPAIGKKLQMLDNIFNSHLTGDRDILDCQEELIKAGLKEYAKL